MAKSTDRADADARATEAAAADAEAREHALLATPQGQADKDLLPEPHVGSVHTPLVYVEYNDSVFTADGEPHAFYLGEPIEKGMSYLLSIGEATAVMSAGHGTIVGTEDDADRLARVDEQEKEIAREAAKQAKLAGGRS